MRVIDVTCLVEFRPVVLEEISEGTNGRTMDSRTDAQKKIMLLSHHPPFGDHVASLVEFRPVI